MSSLDGLTEADLRGPLTSKSLSRARGYISRVQDAVRAGRTLNAQVRGSRLYDVEIDVKSGGITADCTCAYNWGGYCKHIGAVLLKWIRSPGSFAVRDAAPSSSEDQGEYPFEVVPVEPLPTYRPDELPSWLVMPLTDRTTAKTRGNHQADLRPPEQMRAVGRS